jgi:hypothetical protein
MATTTHRGITYTSSGSATMQVQLDLPLQAGVDQDETTWLTSYPGALTSFAARQTDGANRMQPRLVCLGVGALAEGETIILSGDCNVIISANVSKSDATASVAISHSALTITADVEQVDDGTTDDTSNCVIWIIVG